MFTKPIINIVALLFMWAGLSNLVLGQDVNSKGATSAMKSLNGTSDPFADIAVARLDPSCEPNATTSRLQATRERLARLQSALADTRSTRVDTAGLLDGDALNKFSKVLGALQIGDAAMQLYAAIAGDKVKNAYEMGKSIGDCANAAFTDVNKTPGGCVGGLLKSADKLLPSKVKDLSPISIGAAGSAIGAVDKLAQGKPGEALAEGVSAVSQQMKSAGVDEGLAKGLGTVGTTVKAVDAAKNGETEKYLETMPKALSQLVGKDTPLGRIFDKEGDLAKAVLAGLNGIDNISNSSTEGANLDKIISSNLQFMRKLEDDLTAKIAATKDEIRRLTACQEQLEAAGLANTTKKSEATDVGKTAGTLRSLDEIMAARRTSLNGLSTTQNNSAFAQALRKSMQQALTSEIGRQSVSTPAENSFQIYFLNSLKQYATFQKSILPASNNPNSSAQSTGLDCNGRPKGSSGGSGGATGCR